MGLWPQINLYIYLTNTNVTSISKILYIHHLLELYLLIQPIFFSHIFFLFLVILEQNLASSAASHILIDAVYLCAVSPCGVLFTQGFRISPTTLHRLRQHRLHHPQPIIVLLWPRLAAPCWLSWEPIVWIWPEPGPLLGDRQWSEQSSPSSASSSSSLWSVEISLSSEWVYLLVKMCLFIKA